MSKLLCIDILEISDQERENILGQEMSEVPGEEKIKRCSHCGIPKNLSEFRKYPQAKDGLRYSCRTCESEWKRNRLKNMSPEDLRVFHEKTLSRRKLNQNYVDRYKIQRERNLAWLLSYLSIQYISCKKCNYHLCWNVLEFHHTDPNQKEGRMDNFSAALKSGLQTFMKWVKRNDGIFLCANCHRELHAGIWDIKEVMNEHLCTNVGVPEVNVTE